MKSDPKKEIAEKVFVALVSEHVQAWRVEGLHDPPEDVFEHIAKLSCIAAEAFIRVTEEWPQL